MTHLPGIVDSDTFVLSIGGLRIAARTTGSGDPVLLLNGMSRPMASWASFAGALRNRTVVAFDGPGVGASETPIVPYSMPMLSDVAARVLDAVGIEKADVVGYSHGGAVAQQLAVGHPTRVNRLVLLATACGVGAVPGHPRDVTQMLLTPNRATQWPRPDPLGLLWQVAAISTWVQHPRSRLHRCTHPRGLRRLRPGRPAGEQSATCGAHPRRPPCHRPGRTRSAKAQSGGDCGPPGGEVSRFATFDDGVALPVEDNPNSSPDTNYRRPRCPCPEATTMPSPG
jgi:pimeloyl-ACP methyl ester carboxylesterase